MEKKYKVAGISFDKKFRIYVLWCLKLMKDVPSIFSQIDFFERP